MIARAYDPRTDAQALAELLKGDMGDLHPDRDALVVVESKGRILCAIACRPMVYVHECAVADAMMARKLAELALSYSLGTMRAMGHREAIFQVDPANKRMQAWLESNEARRQGPGELWTMEIR